MMEAKQRTPVTYCIVSKVEMDALMKEINMIYKREKRAINLPVIAKLTLQELKDVFSYCHETTSRVADVVELRHFARYFLCCNTQMSLKRIGVITNATDHSTVISSRDKIKNDIVNYENVENRYIGFERRIMVDIQNMINRKEAFEQTQEEPKINLNQSNINDKESKSVNEVQEVLANCV